MIFFIVFYSLNTVQDAVIVQTIPNKGVVAVSFVTTARFVTKVTKRAAMPARFVTNEVHLIVCVCVCERERQTDRQTEKERERERTNV